MAKMMVKEFRKMVDERLDVVEKDELMSCSPKQKFKKFDGRTVGVWGK